MNYTNTYQSPLGNITLASDGENLTGLWFNDQKYFAVTLSTDHQEKDLPVFNQVKLWLDGYFQGEVPTFMPPISLEGSLFRQDVWEVLQQIPYGTLMTYGEIANQIAKKNGLKTMSSQAIGGAVGHNPISIIVPCHRVVGSNGSLTGYAGGIERKLKLLTLENTDIQHLFIPKKGTAL